MAEPQFPGRRVLLLEFNEITWPVMDRLIKRGKLPNLRRMLGEGSWALPRATEVPPHLDPWVTWVTLHTGVPREVHGASVLEQESNTIRAKRSWDYVLDAGKSVGIFGSISAYPPRAVQGFMVPGPFAPGPETYPPELQPVQALNRRYTAVHNKLGREDSALSMAKLGLQLLNFGLSPATCARIATQLLRERVAPHQYWRRVGLQPLVNYDFFSKLYKRFRPHFATWHSNHAAHYMHHYWRAYDDSTFLTRASEEEKTKYGAAVPYGYELMDELLGKFIELVDDDTVIAIASSMGQQPYRQEQYAAGRIVVRFKDVQQVLGLVGARVDAVHPVMAPQWNVVIRDAAERARVRDALKKAHRTGCEGEDTVAISVEETADTLTLTPKGLARPQPGARYFFPDAPAARAEGYGFDELFAADQPTPKQGMHQPEGFLLLWGRGIAPGHFIEETSNLDVAPTLLSLMGIAVPAEMPGRVLSSAWMRRSSAAPGQFRVAS